MMVKWIAAYVTQRIYHLSPADRSMLYQLSNAHTAVALAVVMIGFTTGIFGEEILNGTVLMILVTCTVSSVRSDPCGIALKLLQLEAEQASGGRCRRRCGTAGQHAHTYRQSLTANEAREPCAAHAA